MDSQDGAQKTAAGGKFSVCEQVSRSQIQIPFDVDIDINGFLCAQGEDSIVPLIGDLERNIIDNWDQFFHV